MLFKWDKESGPGEGTTSTHFMRPTNKMMTLTLRGQPCVVALEGFQCDQCWGKDHWGETSREGFI